MMFHPYVLPMNFNMCKHSQNDMLIGCHVTKVMNDKSLNLALNKWKLLIYLVSTFIIDFSNDKCTKIGDLGIFLS